MSVTKTGLLSRVRRLLPEGRSLPEDAWRRRHNTIVVLLCVHAVGIPVYAVTQGYGLAHGFVEGAPTAAAAAFAGLGPRNRKFRAAVATAGLITASAVLTHLSHGLIEMHFHFFVMIGVITLYQDWFPFLLAIGYVLVHHGLMGALYPDSVYNHAAALNNPWKWAGVHAAFIMGASIASVVAWRMNETERARADEYSRRLYEQRIRQREALQINDNVVQGLAVAKYALEMGDDGTAREAVEHTLRSARGIISDLLGETGMGPGDLVRDKAAVVIERRT